ncbi:hypothetical protein DPMN_058207 [Dreissena polymorpha]|uniref:Uncharacterized protein n=1 Tax=Dreissena polymorpha TaxID=45954 RepID=A0A9D4C1B2_DREPO|nr:hypothetical protein DPMN_058207 [Dreissena polymorpha]
MQTLKKKMVGSRIHQSGTTPFVQNKNLVRSLIRFTSTLGCIDWTHVHIKKPVNHVEGYIWRKGVPTINVQAVYDASYRITSFTQVHCQLARAKA